MCHDIPKLSGADAFIKRERTLVLLTTDQLFNLVEEYNRDTLMCLVLLACIQEQRSSSRRVPRLDGETRKVTRL